MSSFFSSFAVLTEESPMSRASFTAYPEGSSMEMDDLPPPSSSCRAKFLSYFKMEKRNSSITTEIRSGLISFLTMSYVMLVNPHVMSPNACQNIPTECLSREDVVVATALSSAVGTLIGAFGGNLPFVLVPGIGLSTYYASGLVLAGMQKEVALATVAISGALTLLLSVTKVSTLIMGFIPDAIKTATVVGVGMLIAFVGLQSVDILVADDSTLVKLGDLSQWPIILTILGLTVLVVLTHFGVKGGTLLQIVLITAISWIGGVSDPPSTMIQLPEIDSVPFDVLTDGMTHLDSSCIMPILTFTLVAILDMAGVMHSLGKMADLIDEETQQLGGSTWGYAASGVGTILAGLVGSTPVMIGIESAAGIYEGGRTGATALTAAMLFLISVFFAPLLGSVPPQATAPVLVMIGAMMSKNAQDIPWSKMRKSIPAFLTIIIMPFTNSIPYGLAAGLGSYAFLWLLTHPRRIWHAVRYGRCSGPDEVASVYNSLAGAAPADVQAEVVSDDVGRPSRMDMSKWEDQGILDDDMQPQDGRDQHVSTMAAYFVPGEMMDDGGAPRVLNSQNVSNMRQEL